MPAKLWNWRLWAGFILSLVALLGYAFVVASTGALAVFWPSLVLFVIAAVLLISGFTRSRREPQTYRGKICRPGPGWPEYPVSWPLQLCQLPGVQELPGSQQRAQSWPARAGIYPRRLNRQKLLSVPTALHPDWEFRRGHPDAQRRAGCFLSGLLVRGLHLRVTGDSAQLGLF